MVLAVTTADSQLVKVSEESFKCPDTDCRLECNIFIRCPACVGFSAANCFHDLEALRVHYEHYQDDETHQKYDPFRKMSLVNLAQILESTVKGDYTSKIVTFLNCLLAQSEDSQFNILFVAESSAGKTYVAMQVASYFPGSEKIVLAGATPQSFVYQQGQRSIEVESNVFESVEETINDLSQELQDLKVKEKKSPADKTRISDVKEELFQLRKKSVMLIDLESKILIFLDQPRTDLLARLRALFSHDDKYLRFQLVNRNQRGANYTENIVLKGYPSTIFCTASGTMDDQEATRNVILSPEVNQRKILSGMLLAAQRKADPAGFQREMRNNDSIAGLKFRVQLIRAFGVRNFTCSESGKEIVDRLVKDYPQRNPRDQRDVVRLFDFIYGVALLNCFNHERDEDAIEATEEDIHEGFELFSKIMESNSHGVSPEAWEIFENVIKPACERKLALEDGELGLRIEWIKAEYLSLEGREIDYERLTREILRPLCARGLLTDQKDPLDKRFHIYGLPLKLPERPEKQKVL